MKNSPRLTRYVLDQQGGDYIVVERRTGIVSGRKQTRAEAEQLRDELNSWWEVQPGRSPMLGGLFIAGAAVMLVFVILAAIVLFLLALGWGGSYL